MIAHIRHEPWNDRIQIYVASDSDRRRVATGIDEHGHIRWEEVPYGVETPVFLSLPPEMLKAIVDAAQAHVPASDATTAHLNDAIKVRDRLLTLVEAR